MTPAEQTFRPGAVRLFEGGRALALALGVWASKTETGHLEIRLTGTSTFHTTVTNYKGSERYHWTLFRNLRQMLIDHGVWPYGEEGAEPEEARAAS
jgi:hypothetical protein